MQTDIYVRDLKTDERERLIRENYTFCKCCDLKTSCNTNCDFWGTKFLHYYEGVFHAVNGCDNECEDRDCVACSFSEASNRGNVVILNNSDEFLKYMEEHE